MLLLLAPLLAAACADKSAPADPPDAGAPAAPLREEDLAAVCTGKAEPRAKPFAKDGTSLHPIAVFSQWDRFATPKPERPHILNDLIAENAAAYELVACVARTAEGASRTCKYEVTKNQQKRDLQVIGATYEITLREASTAAVLGARTVTFPTPACPSGHTFKDALDNKMYPDAGYAVADLAKTFVVPPGGVTTPPPAKGNPYLEHFKLAKVCYGIPEPNAAAHEKVSGKVSPALVMSRAGENEGYYTHGYPEWKPWQVENAAGYQILACVSEKSRAKKKECKITQQGVTRRLDQHAATYEIVVREVKTAKVLSTTTASAEPDKACPKDVYFPDGRDQVDDVAWPRKEVEDLVRPLAEPK